jgi:exodeoxyribonuclease V alpha subunit
VTEQLPLQRREPVEIRELEGTVERIVFANPENGWAVIRLTPAAGGSRVTAVGSLLQVREGERLRLSGEWVEDRKYGRQFSASSYLTLMPETVVGLRKYLGSGLIPGVGRVTAERLVDAFGLETLDVIERHPERLARVEGIGPKRREQIRRAWLEQRAVRDVMIFLQAHRISSAYAARIHKRYGAEATEVVRRNPYRLAEEIHGIGFRTADRVAASLGIEKDDPARIVAGLLFVLQRASDQGHVYLPVARTIEAAAELLDLAPAKVEEGLEVALVADKIVREERGGVEAAFLPVLRDAERRLAERLALLLTADGGLSADERRTALGLLANRPEARLSEEQWAAVEQAVTSKVLIITGGPGTGKTTLVQGIVGAFARIGRRIELAAPTGRAAKRLSAATSRDARTLHRLLEFDPRAMRFQRHRERPIDAHVVIVDEASMLDCLLAGALADAVPERAQLILVGDVDQLPSVGPGRVLDDLIRSGCVPVARLSEVFRQAAASRIVRNAHRVRNGRMPRFERGRRDDDFFFIPRDDPADLLDTLRHLVTERIPAGFGLDPYRDIQLLTPMRRGLLGVESLNREFQELLNPHGEAIPLGTGSFRLGDRVMQVRNDYDLDVFNGDVGRIVGFDDSAELARVDLEGRLVEYDSRALEDLHLAYACSIHKSQGSEYPCVVMALHTQHRMLLQRNLLYTGITRGRRLVVLVGSRAAVAMAVRNHDREERFTALAERLRRAVAAAAAG